MKKILTIILLSAIAVVFSACEKQNSAIDDKIVAPESDLNIEKQIQDFLANVENPQKDGETLSIEEAVWNIEAGLNYTNIETPEQFGNILIDSAKIDIPVSDGFISMDDIAIAYAMFEDSLSNFYSSLDENYLKYVTDISVIETNNKSNTITFKSTSLASRPNPVSITSDDYWYWGWELGMCDGSGAYVGRDAADRIMQVANNNVAVPVNGDYVYPTSIETISFDAPELPDPNNPYGNYMLFQDAQEQELFHHCMSPNEMSYYYNSLLQIGADNKPASKDLISYNLEDWTAYGLTEPPPPIYDTWYMIHHADITYGIWHIGSGGGIEQ
jgi:hypothetical protein